MPPAIHDPLLGELRYVAALGWYEGRGEWQGDPGLWAVSAETPGEVEPALATARRLAVEGAHWRGRIDAALVDELLPLKNGEWLDAENGEEPLTAEGLLARAALETIIAFPDETVEITLRDNGLFFGHALLVTLDLGSGRVDATLAG